MEYLVTLDDLSNVGRMEDGAKMTIVTASKARDAFSDIISSVAFGNETVCISRNKKVLAAIISKENLDLFQRLLREAEDRLDAQDVRAARDEAEEAGTISLEELESDLGL